MSNKNLHSAKRKKNDEFYTQLKDIENEMINYISHFKDKIVFCNCNDGLDSKFVEYFSKNFHFLGLKKLIHTSYCKDGQGKLYTFSGFKEGKTMPESDDWKIIDLKGDGGFDSDECKELLKESDIIVTNPPFSLFREFIKVMMDYDKRFLVIGNQNAITYKEVFPLIKDNRLWLGVNSNKSMDFVIPDSYKIMGGGYTDDNGKKHGIVPGITWFTNLPHNKRNQELILYKKYKGNEDKYPIYDNYMAFNIDKTKDIPEDDFIDLEVSEEECKKWKTTYGDDCKILEPGKIRINKPIFGVPISFLDKYCPEQFEIVSFRKGDDGKDVFFFYKRERERVQPYFRVFIRRR